MAQITNLNIAIGAVENLSFGISLPPAPPPPLRKYKRVTLNFVMTFSPQEVGLTYRLSAQLFANDNAMDDIDDGRTFFGENGGLTKISDFQQNDRWNLFPKSYKEIIVTSTSMPYTISEYVLRDSLNEDTAFGFVPSPTGPKPVSHKDELLARVLLSQVAEIKSTPEAL